MYFDFRSEGCQELEVKWVGSPSSIQLAPQEWLPAAEVVVVVNLEGEEANPRSSPRKLSTPRTRFHSYASLGGERREMSPQGSDISIYKTISVLVTPGYYLYYIQASRPSKLKNRRQGFRRLEKTHCLKTCVNKFVFSSHARIFVKKRMPDAFDVFGFLSDHFLPFLVSRKHRHFQFICS